MENSNIWYQNRIDKLEETIESLRDFIDSPKIDVFRSSSGKEYTVFELYKILEEYEEDKNNGNSKD